MCLPGLFGGGAPDVQYVAPPPPPPPSFAPEVKPPEIGVQDANNRKVGKRRFKTQTLDTIGVPKQNTTLSGGGIGLPLIGAGGNSANSF